MHDPFIEDLFLHYGADDGSCCLAELEILCGYDTVGDFSAAVRRGEIDPGDPDRCLALVRSGASEMPVQRLCLEQSRTSVRTFVRNHPAAAPNRDCDDWALTWPLPLGRRALDRWLAVWSFWRSGEIVETAAAFDNIPVWHFPRSEQDIIEDLAPEDLARATRMLKLVPILPDVANGEACLAFVLARQTATARIWLLGPCHRKDPVRGTGIESDVSVDAALFPSHYDVASYQIDDPILQTEHSGPPSSETRRLEDNLSTWYARHMQGRPLKVRRGRPPGTGTFSNADEFRAVVTPAVLALRARHHNPTAAAVCRYLHTRLGNALDPAQFTRWYTRWWPTWENFLSTVTPPN